MQVFVEYYGHLRRAAGCSAESLEVATATPEGVLDAVCEKHTTIGAARDSIAVAVGDSLVAPSAIIDEGATVALLPPVAGG